MASDLAKYAGIGAAVTFVIGLGTAIPAVGTFLGVLFTFGGGFVGGAVAAGLYKRDASGGIKVALLATAVGGVASSILASIAGTILTIVFVNDPTADVTGFIMLSAIGFVTGIPITLIGGIIGGALLGAIVGDQGE